MTHWWRARDEREKSHNTYKDHVPCQSSDQHAAVERAPPHTSIIKPTAKVTAVVIDKSPCAST